MSQSKEEAFERLHLFLGSIPQATPNLTKNGNTLREDKIFKSYNGRQTANHQLQHD